LIDEVSIYSRPLSQTEIMAIFLAGSAGKSRLNFPPGIITQPANLAVVRGSNAMFNVVAAGTAPLSYQWLFNSVNIAGATNSLFYMSNVQSNNSGSYAVIVSNLVGTITSSNAHLAAVAPLTITLTNPPDNSVLFTTNLVLMTAISDLVGTVTQVQFFQGTSSLGMASPTGILTWTNPSAGNYLLSAVAADSAGLTVTSAERPRCT